MTGQEARSMLKNPKGGGNYPDNFTEDELQQIGLGYDRMVRFMEKDDPNLRHPEVKDHEEWEQIEQGEMAEELGNKARSSIGQCAAWMRPDIVYVKKPVFQCRFEPQDDFFKPIIPFLNPKTEQDFLFELENDDGSVELCTYFGGLLELLHPYTKEWKAKLDEMELGCDAPDEEDDATFDDPDETEILDWIEDEGSDGDANITDEDEDEEDLIDDYGDEDQDLVMDMEESKDGKFHAMEEDTLSDEDEKDFNWNEEFQKALSSGEAMENLAKKTLEFNKKLSKKQFMMNKEEEETAHSVDGDETDLRGKQAKVSQEEWKYIGVGPWRKRNKKSKIPPELFLRAVVRPFTYRNLVKEIVLTRHAILDGEIGA
ncbi:hypothetical protein JHK85_005511 [Glycine max]|nr:hypothetical protein JHK85_005511 [Glycine max]KAG5081282.1 hypothetical protein JHK86_005347 [Glycine max]